MGFLRVDDGCAKQPRREQDNRSNLTRFRSHGIPPF
jgi:hypothetical protein